MGYGAYAEDWDRHQLYHLYKNMYSLRRVLYEKCGEFLWKLLWTQGWKELCHTHLFLYSPTTDHPTTSRPRFDQWSDGKCDCNCGRWDWDCAGDRGIPEMWVREKLDLDLEKVNMNCPEGVNANVPIPDRNSTELPPKCGEIKASPEIYKY